MDGTGALVSQFVYATHINVPDYIIKGGVTYRIITDHLGSLRFVIDVSTGTIAQRMDYDDWGNVLVNTAPDFTPFGFAGGMYDRQTKLVRFGARDYDAEVGRWTAKDPIGFGGADANIYCYLFNEPLNNIDANGLGGGCCKQSWGTCYSKCLDKLAPGFSAFFAFSQIAVNAPYTLVAGQAGGRLVFRQVPNAFSLVAPRAWQGLATFSDIVAPVQAVVFSYVAGVSYGCMIRCAIDCCSY